MRGCRLQGPHGIMDETGAEPDITAMEGSEEI